MSLAADLAAAIAREARLRMLRELAGQTDGRLSDILLKRTLDIYGYRRDRDWIRTQMRKLAELGAVSLHEAGDVLFARIEGPGHDHLEERSIIEGVMRPSEDR
ncbi:hypothetical protein [Erythrobacter sp. WG]|uniref:VpaChn25_0724 family phage protein n=1 Tax=Erythrobacter sp. WG TaxID=2985510 RepID=UPI002270BF28|nr:hypothetical protein [Erythrobacter sp. WG]MCX9146605.1 hypothetical protein [Erythrobacter sp. WG]